jgi:hypothetical protein
MLSNTNGSPDPINLERMIMTVLGHTMFAYLIDVHNVTTQLRSGAMRIDLVHSSSPSSSFLYPFPGFGNGLAIPPVGFGCVTSAVSRSIFSEPRSFLHLQLSLLQQEQLHIFPEELHSFPQQFAVSHTMLVVSIVQSRINPKQTPKKEG